MRPYHFGVLLVGAALAASCYDAPATSPVAPPVCGDFSRDVPPNAKKVSFKDDVMGIIGPSCAFDTCHGKGTGSGDLKLQNPAKASDPAKAIDNAYAALVNVKSPQLAAMPLVAPGDPRNSYLMHKVDGDHCLYNDQCVDNDCGSLMPEGGEKLDLADRDTIRAWIAQGAEKN